MAEDVEESKSNVNGMKFYANPFHNPYSYDQYMKGFSKEDKPNFSRNIEIIKEERAKIIELVRKEEESSDPKPDEVKSDEPKVDEPNVDEPKVEEAKPEEPKVDEPKADESKAEAPMEV